MNVIIYGLTSQDMVDIDQAFGIIENVLGRFCISLSDQERLATPAMGDRRLSFAMKAFSYAQQFPQILPGTIELPKYIRLHKEWLELMEIVRKMRTIGQMLDDGVLVTGTSYYAFGRLFYSNVQENLEENIAGLTTVDDELSVQFLAQSGPNFIDEPVGETVLPPVNDGGNTVAVS